MDFVRVVTLSDRTLYIPFNFFYFLKIWCRISVKELSRERPSERILILNSLTILGQCQKVTK